ETDFRVIRVRHTVQAVTREEERAQAQAISEQYNATLVMWGSVSDGGVRYYFETTPRRSRVSSRVDELAVSVAEIENFDTFIFEGMDVVYILEFTVGQLFYFEQDYEMALIHFQKAEAR